MTCLVEWSVVCVCVVGANALCCSIWSRRGWLKKSIQVLSYLLPFSIFFFFLCVAQVWAIRDTKASYSNRFCTRFARGIMPATITQEMHITKGQFATGLSLINVTCRSSQKLLPAKCPHVLSKIISGLHCGVPLWLRLSSLSVAAKCSLSDEARSDQSCEIWYDCVSRQAYLFD